MCIHILLLAQLNVVAWTNRTYALQEVSFLPFVTKCCTVLNAGSYHSAVYLSITACHRDTSYIRSVNMMIKQLAELTASAFTSCMWENLVEYNYLMLIGVYKRTEFPSGRVIVKSWQTTLPGILIWAQSKLTHKVTLKSKQLNSGRPCYILKNFASSCLPSKSP
jgi:hypothetical protein